MSDSIRVVLVDDEKNAGDRYGGLLGKCGLEVEHRFPPQEFDVKSLVDPAPDLFLVDYELTSKRGDGQAASYRGWSLATALREELGDRPIVLLTRTGLATWRAARRSLEASRIVDAVEYKTDIERDSESAAKRLVSLACGYAIIRNQEPTYQGLCEALRARSSEETAALSEATPPRSGWQPFEAAAWIRNVVLAFPGILYDALHAATTLGLSRESFDNPKVRAEFNEAHYEGVFSDVEHRWWRSRLFEVAERLRQNARIPGPLNVAVPQALGNLLHVGLQSPPCTYSGQVPADWVCCLLKVPVKYDFTLAYGMDDRPKVMDEARISFKAIAESQDVRLELFDKYSAELAEDMQKSPGKYRRTIQVD